MLNKRGGNMSKKIIFLIFALVLIVPSIVYSAAVTRTTAEQVAMNWYSERNDKAPNDFSIIESFIEKENTENLFFIFNFDKTGFVMVSADDASIPILGYIFEHNYTLEDHPPQFDAMLASFKKQIIYIKENDLSAPKETQDEWERLNVRTENFERIRDFNRLGPLLSTTWDQGLYFNEMCPADGASTAGNGFVWAGCTATATAQVMKYHAHPVTGEGSHSYIPSTNPVYGLQSANFGATTYNWALMPNNVTSLIPSVQTLLYHVGVGVDMDYGPTGSSAWIGGVAWASALSALKDYFKYDLNAYHAWKSSYTVPVWDGMLHFELDNNRPLVYAGYNATQTSGHAFVLDGYHSTTLNYYHFNWGWSGWYDGYFFLTSLIPTAGYDYTYDQNALFLVEPRKWRPLPDVAIDVSLLPYTGVDLDHYYEGPVALLSYSVVTDLSLEEFALAINTNNELVFTANPTVTSDVNIDITIRATYTGGTADDTFNFIITGTSSGSTNPPLLLADDFLCTETGYITDIHIWGSWIDDHIPFFEAPEAVEFTFSIHSDIPAGVIEPWSMPGDVLWIKTWIPNWDDVEWINFGPEDWYNPFLPMWLDDNHNMCYKYNYILDPQDYFLQEGTEQDPIIYWLDVQAVPMDIDPACRFGWKTSLDHWNDDAVWTIGNEPYNGPWEELRYPFGHEYELQSIDLAFQITTEEEPTDEYDFGDAPEGASAIAYPSTGVTGSFPTCITVGSASSYIQHGSGENLAWFGPMVDLETDGNAGACPGCFPAYDSDECFQDGDAGLIMPDSYTIDATGVVVNCSGSTGSSLGIVCNNATWGVDIDIDVTNNMLVDGYINVLFDWNQDGQWQNDLSTQCAGITVHEYVVPDLGIPAGYSGTLSGLLPPSSTFQIGPNAGYVWVRFSITDVMIGLNDWDGSGVFDDGESEDYLLHVEEELEELDFGDAPDPTYPTLLAVGARHILDGVTYLGAQIDAEPDGQPDATATGDDNDGNDDEDGVLFVSPIIPGEQGAVYVQASTNGLLNAWLDFDGSGSWDASEQIFTDRSLIPGWNSLNFSVPTSAIPGNTFARFRFDTGGGLGVTGSASDGEVEDYQVEIEENLHDGLKMHYHQWPDTTQFGVDVCVMEELDYTRIVADDFLCVETGPINSIHIWGSWKFDEIIPDNAIFDLAIWSDNPIGPSGWSEPLTLLWQKQFIPGEYNESIYYDTPNGEWWYDPCTGEFIFPGDFIVWEYHFIIPDTSAYMQEAGTIYWLSVRTHFVEPSPEQFGWKSSVNHWNDDAVYQCMYPTDPWTEMIYPFSHPFNQSGEEHVSMDMAFYIDCHPRDPQNITISKVGTNITLQWDSSWCASYYNIYSSTDPYATFPGGWTLEATGITVTTWNDPVSTAGSKKFYRVTAEN
jgi:hypothetical protein